MLFRLRSATCAYVLRVMPTSVARWVNEAKTPRGGVFGEVKSSAQGNEGEGYAPTRIDYAAGQARSDNPEVVGERGKRARWALFPKRYPTKQGVEGVIYDCNVQRPCDWGGQRDPTPATNKKRTFVYQKFLFCLSIAKQWHIIAVRRISSPKVHIISHRLYTLSH